MMKLSDAIRAQGWTPPQNILTGKTTRFATGDKGNDRNGWVYAFPDGTGAIFGCWRLDINHIWQLKRDKPLTKAELTELKHEAEQAKRLAEIDKEQHHQQASTKAVNIWRNATPAINHPYLERKQIQAHQLRVNHTGLLLVPIYNEAGLIVNLQFINADGEKRFLSGGQKRGCFSVIGTHTDNNTILICEGWATGASLNENSDLFTVVALDAGNLKAVAQVWRKLRPDAEIIVCGDNDSHGKGQKAAHLAALSVGGLLMIPPVTGMDFNDWLNEGHAINIPSTFATFAPFAFAKPKNMEVLAND